MTLEEIAALLDEREKAIGDPARLVELFESGEVLLRELSALRLQYLTERNRYRQLQCEGGAGDSSPSPSEAFF